MNELDRQFVEMTARITATEVVREFRETLQCAEHDNLIDKHESTLNNGLKDSVIDLKQETTKLREQIQQGGWSLIKFGATLAGGAALTLLGVFLEKAIGG
jgi:broad-specificity NMP kinase